MKTNEEKKAQRQAYYLKNKVRQDANTRRNYQAVRAGVLAAYGGKCACCGESTPEFLGVDHIFNDGAYDRKILKMSGYTLYRHLKRNNYPTDRFQLLCHNCNQAKGYYGVCPHRRQFS